MRSHCFNRVYASIQRQWYHKLTWLILLIPLEVLFRCCTSIRRYVYRFFAYPLSLIPIWIVGDITVGGSGKSPFLIWLSSLAAKQGVQCVIIGHAYKSNILSPQICTEDSDPVLCGDEAVMMAQLTGLPVVVAPSRYQALLYIEAQFPSVDLILCDDGLQDYRLRRSKEIVVYNPDRIGNGYCFPVGPLREQLKRLNQVDLCVRHAPKNSDSDMLLTPQYLRRLSDGRVFPVTHFMNQTVHAVSAIADNNRFFKQLEKLDFNIIPHGFMDHHVFVETDLLFGDGYPVVITEKDAVKCRGFKKVSIYALHVELYVNKVTQSTITNWIKQL